MALFGTKKNTTKKPAPAASVVAVKKAGPAIVRDLSGIIRRPHITEKASFSAEQGVYIFNVATTATKHTVAAAISELYNVKPVKVTVAAITEKKKFSRGAWGVKGGGKKAHVFLKKGDVIEFV